METSWHVAMAAEAFAAGQFARFGWKISVQYGPNQPEYDLLAERDDVVLKVSVKGSQDGGWGLTQSYLKNANYHAAAEEWLAGHSPLTVFCLVQFKGVGGDELPRMYLAAAAEIARQLQASAAGRGDTVLHEKHAWGPRAYAKGTVDQLPETWRFTESRLASLAARCAGLKRMDKHVG